MPRTRTALLLAMALLSVCCIVLLNIDRRLEPDGSLGDSSLEVSQEPPEDSSPFTARRTVPAFEIGADASCCARVDLAQVAASQEGTTQGDRLSSTPRDPDPMVRAQAVEALADSEVVEHVATLADLLADEDEDVRAEAASALGDVRAREGLEHLMDALFDESEEVRDEAISALGRRGDIAALPALSELYAARGGAVSFRLLKTMKRLGDDRPFRRELERLSRSALAGRDAEVRYRAVRTLARHAPHESRPLFLLLTDDPDARVRRAATRAARSTNERRTR